ncbi:MAG: putative zinc-binding metallopeptidase [Planctomycetota bacterium]
MKDAPQTTHARRAAEPPPWAELSHKELLTLRVRDLGLRIEGTYVEKRVARLYRELGRAGITFRPLCYLSDDWFAPDGVPAVGIPFWLAHPKLRRLEKKMMLDVEGGSDDEFMRIMRHECGHTINYAYLLHRKTRWRKLFGPMGAAYKDMFRVRPYSRRYVRNLDNFYAQMHPDEDFAETFAVWLRPRSDWRKDYAGWRALEKLEYVDELMREDVIGWQPRLTARSRDCIARADRMKLTLEAYYKKRRAEYAWEYADFFDPDLKRLFRTDADAAAESAARFLRRRRGDLLDEISRWSRESKFNIDRVLRDLIERCDELGLRVHRPETETVLEVTAYLTTLVVNYLHTGEFKRHR